MEGVGIVSVFFFVPSVGGDLPWGHHGLFPLFSELPRAPWAVVAVFVSGLSMHKTAASTRQ